MLGCQLQGLKSFIYVLKGAAWTNAAWVSLCPSASVAQPWSGFHARSELAEIVTWGVNTASHSRGF